MAAATAIAAILACRGPVTTHTHHTQGQPSAAWSAPVADLRGRLIAGTAISEGAPFAIDLELENIGAQPLEVTFGDPFAVTAEVTDASGTPVPPSGARLDVLSTSEVVELAPHARSRRPLSSRHDDVTAHLDVTTAYWILAKGRYQLSVRWKSEARGSWVGELILPPIELDVR
jgi:hypothetical protein